MEKKLHILMLEDVPSDAELIERELRKSDLNYSAIRVDTKEAFLKELKDFSPDLILSDYSLPTFNGMAALNLVKELSLSTPFIIVTGSLNEETAVECIKAGASDYVIKENLVRLGSAIKSALEKKHAMEEKERAEEALIRQTQELARSNQELGQFAFVASHDLQEPLRKIITFGDRLKEHSARALDEMGRDYLYRMQHAALRMKELVEGLLQYSTVSSKLELFDRVNLETLVHEVAQDLEVSIAKSNARLEIENLPTLEGDAIQLRQLFQNLIANALKFSKKDKVPHVKIKSHDLKNGFSEITVEDNGIGFDTKHADRIFMPFQRLHSLDEYAGTGMGLTICHRIVQRHGGQITARSTPGKGSTFIITLPLPKERGSIE